MAIYLTTAVFAFTLAPFIYRAGPSRPENRLLAILVLLFGIGSSGGMMLYLTDRPAVTMGAQAVIEVVSVFGQFVFYPWLLSRLSTPLAAPFRTRTYRAASLLFAMAILVLFVVWPAGLVAGVIRPWYAPWDALYGPVPPYYQTVGILLSLYFLVLTISAWRRAPMGSLRRRQAGTFALAFGIMDAATAAFLVRIRFAEYGSQHLLDLTFLVVLPIVHLVFLTLLTYGILKVQLLDIDLRLKWGVSRGSVAGSILVAFLVVSQLVENMATERLGLLFGSLAAGLMLFLIRPLSRFADDLADAALPHVQDTEEYRLVRKKELYRAAIESALEDGAVTDRERSMLATLADQLGLSSKEALELERSSTAVSVHR